MDSYIKNTLQIIVLFKLTSLCIIGNSQILLDSQNGWI